MTERRRRVLTDADAIAIAEAITTNHAISCRYSIPPERMDAAIRFYENMNSIMEDSKKTIRRSILTLVVAGFALLLGAGTVYKIWAIAHRGSP